MSKLVELPQIHFFWKGEVPIMKDELYNGQSVGHPETWQGYNFFSEKNNIGAKKQNEFYPLAVRVWWWEEVHVSLVSQCFFNDKSWGNELM